MQLSLFGINHTSAPAGVRDAVAMTAEEIGDFVVQYRERIDAVQELVVLSTCHRTELYMGAADTAAAGKQLRDVVCTFKGVEHMHNGQYTFEREGREAAKHLFRVAAGLDSLMIGEDQILGQVKDALAVAERCGAPGSLLTRFFHAAVHTGKRVRSETEIGRGAVSIAYAAVGMATKVFNDLAQHSVAVVGAGETGRLVGLHFRDQRPAQLFVLNRTFERARQLAEELGGRARPFDELAATLREVDVVVSATVAPEPVMSAEMLAEVMRERGGRPLVAIDIASPGDIDPAAGRLANLFLYDLDALGAITEHNRAQRAKEIPKAERIVDDEQRRFFRWYETLAVTPVVRALRKSFEEIGRREARKHGKQFHRTDRETLERYTQALISKLLHHPTLGLKDLDRSTPEGFGKLAAMRDLFRLDADGDGPGSEGDGESR